MTARNSTNKIFYTYAHYRASEPERGPFYIGKGTGPRAWKEDSRSKWWARIVAKYGLRVEILAHWNTEDEAYSHERLLIECMRSMNQKIVNLTAGGDGLRDPDGSVREKISRKVREVWADPQQRARFIAQHSNEEIVSRRSERLKAAFATPESKKKRSESARIAHARADVKEKVLKNAADPIYRSKLSAGVKAASSSPEAKAKRSAASKKRWENPEFLANFQSRMRARSEAKWASMPPEKAEKNRRWVENADRRKANGPMTKREAGNVAGQRNREKAEARRALLPPEERARLEKQAADRLFYKNRKRQRDLEAIKKLPQNWRQAELW